MSHRYSYKDFGEFLNNKNQIVFPKEAGTLKTDSFKIDEDIVLHRNSFEVYKNTNIEYDFILKGITINIALEADFLFQSNISDFSNTQKSNNTIMSIVNKEKGEAKYKANTRLKNIIIFVKQSFIEKILKDSYKLEDILTHLEKGKFSKSIKSNTTNIKTKQCAYEIYKARNDTTLDKLFIQGKVLEILSYEFSELITEKEVELSNITYSEYDLRALKSAKKILMENVKNPPSILELSRQIKLNEFKLKHGFKKVFNTTPYNFLLEYKLHEAKQMLEEGDMNVSEVAFEIGYKQVHGFSNAFYKRFGVRPKDVIKNRKYY